MLSEPLITSLSGLIVGIILSIFTYFLGRFAEKRKQSLIIRMQMLKPIDDWLKGAEKIVGILSDTIVSIVNDLPSPINYDFTERLKISKFMGERTNEVLGIIKAKPFDTHATKKLAKELGEIILKLDNLIKYRLLPLESEIISCSSDGELLDTYVLQATKLKTEMDKLLQRAYSLEAKIKTALT